jgi:hypothetical protein
LDIRKAVDLSSGSCPSRITIDVQNPYNPTFPTDKSPLHEGEYSTSGIIKSYPSGYFYGIGRQENFIGLGTMNYAGIGYVYSPGCWSFNLQAYTVKWSVPRRESQLLGLSGLLTYPVKCYPGRATAGRKINRFPYIQRLWGNASFVMRRSISFLNGNLDGVTRHLNFLTVRSGFIKKKGNHNKTSKYFPAHKMIILIFGTNIWLYQRFVPNDW